jgi:hypothetical protein
MSRHSGELLGASAENALMIFACGSGIRRKNSRLYLVRQQPRFFAGMNINVLVILKWFSPALILVGGLWALLTETTLTDPLGRRRLTGSGWMKVLVLVVGFMLFTATELEDSSRRREQVAMRDAQIAKQNEELEYLRRLFLLQHELSAVEVSWPLRDQDYHRFGSIVNGKQPLLDISDASIYVERAFQYGRIEAVPAATTGRARLDVALLRPQGLYTHRFTPDQLEWKSFEAAIHGLLGNRFQIEIAPGVLLADLVGKHWPCQVTITNHRIAFMIDRPGVGLAHLEKASATFLGGDLQPEAMPTAVRIRSLDPRVTWNQEFTLAWRVEVIEHFQASEEYGADYTRLKAGPYPTSLSLLNMPVVDKASVDVKKH